MHGRAHESKELSCLHQLHMSQPTCLDLFQRTTFRQINPISPYVGLLINKQANLTSLKVLLKRLKRLLQFLIGLSTAASH